MASIIDYSFDSYEIDRTVDGAIEPITNPHGGGWLVTHNGQTVMITDAVLVELFYRTPKSIRRKIEEKWMQSE